MADLQQGISAHGTLIEFAPAATPTVFTEIAEIGDIVMPGLMRNVIDITSHNRDIDTKIVGVLRRETVTFPMFFNKNIPSQALLRTALLDPNPITQMSNAFRITTPDGDVWLFSGGVAAMKAKAPVDGAQTADVEIVPSGAFWLNGAPFGL